MLPVIFYAELMLTVIKIRPQRIHRKVPGLFIGFGEYISEQNRKINPSLHGAYVGGRLRGKNTYNR